MARERRRPLGIETLEGKLLLSTVPAAKAAVAAPPPSIHGKPLALGGVMTAAIYNVGRINAMARTVRIALAGSVGAMGPVEGLLTEQINESLEVVSQGNLTLENSRGSINLHFTHVNVIKNLTTPYNSGFVVDYTITNSTGAFAGATGSGILDVEPDIGDFDMHVTLR